MNRRHALALLAGLPVAIRTAAQPTAPRATRPGAKSRVTLGFEHGFLLEPNGTVKTWLRVAHDEAAPDFLGLGHNRPLDAFTLVPVPGLTNVVTIETRGSSSFAILADGRLVSWGINAGDGMLGSTPLSTLEVLASWAPNSNTPIDPVTRFAAADVSAGDRHVLALAKDGGVYAWGFGGNGRLGIGLLPVVNFKTRTPSAMTYVPYPVHIPNLTDVAAVSAGYAHSLALMKDGTVRAWGWNKHGQIGDGTAVDRDRPIPIAGVRNVVAIATGNTFSLALLADGTVLQWGAIDYIEGRGQGPTLVTGARGLRAIGAGESNVVGLTDAGTVVTWGDNTVYQLGRGRNPPPTPGIVSGISGVLSIAARHNTVAAVLASGKIMTWGVVRPWTRPDFGGPGFSPSPILLWVDGLDQS